MALLFLNTQSSMCSPGVKPAPLSGIWFNQKPPPEVAELFTKVVFSMVIPTASTRTAPPAPELVQFWKYEFLISSLLPKPTTTQPPPPTLPQSSSPKKSHCAWMPESPLPLRKWMPSMSTSFSKLLPPRITRLCELTKLSVPKTSRRRLPSPSKITLAYSSVFTLMVTPPRFIMRRTVNASTTSVQGGPQRNSMVACGFKPVAGSLPDFRTSSHALNRVANRQDPSVPLPMM
mmetsp:Transcript_50792/g.135502  ORF Transcript_50792/g.135502 Transcript_50792/m.135502 type:complete len:232 (+) Transcript_50792:1479-2174(+)